MIVFLVLLEVEKYPFEINWYAAFSNFRKNLLSRYGSAKIDPVEYRKEVSYFFQNASLFDETVQENLSFPARIREEGFDRERAKNIRTSSNT